MPSKRPCYWTRKLELDLVDFVRPRDYIWKPMGNTNHQIQLKYKAYAEFAAKLGPGFTARSVRDRWVNIRSTFTHNLRKVDRSNQTAKTPEEVYIPSWPLWKPLQFLRDGIKKHFSVSYENFDQPATDYIDTSSTMPVKEESPIQSDMELNIRRQEQRTNRPRRRLITKKPKINKCKEVIDDLLTAIKPLVTETVPEQKYWFLGKHVTERLNSMKTVDADAASLEIMRLLDEHLVEKPT